MGGIESESEVVSDSATPWTVAYHAPPSMGFPGKGTGVGCHCLLQRIFLTRGLNLGLLHCRQTFYHLSHQGSQVILALGRLIKSKLHVRTEKWLQPKIRTLGRSISVRWNEEMMVRRRSEIYTVWKEILAKLRVLEKPWIHNLAISLKIDMTRNIYHMIKMYTQKVRDIMYVKTHRGSPLR